MTWVIFLRFSICWRIWMV